MLCTWCSEQANLALRAGSGMMVYLMGVNPDSSTNTAQQAMRQACHNILYTQANSAAVAAADPQSPDQSEGPTQTNDPAQPEGPAGTVYALPEGSGVGAENAWLTAHVTLVQ